MRSSPDIILSYAEIDTRSWWNRQWGRIGRLVRLPLNKWRFRVFGEKSRIDFPSFVVGGKGIEIGSSVYIRRSVRLEAHFVSGGGTRLKIGDNVRIANHVHIGAAQRVEIGANCGIGAFTWITDHDHDIRNPLESVVENQRILIAPTVLEDGVYVGERVAILRGVRIGRGSVIGTNSVVTSDIPPYCVAVGAPARVIRQFDVESQTWRAVG